jgi:hypothetical protein
VRLGTLARLLGLATGDNAMDDMERRIVWLERNMVHILQLSAGAFGATAGFITYELTAKQLELGSLIAVGCSIVAGIITAWFLHRSAFKGGPDIKFLD